MTMTVGELSLFIGLLINAGAVLVSVWLIQETKRAAAQAADTAAKAAVAASEAADGIKVVQRQTDGLMKEVAALAKTQGQQQERSDVATAKELVRTDKLADAKVDAEISAANKLTNPPQQVQQAEDKPVSVADSKVAEIGERSAAALERSALAAEEGAKFAMEEGTKKKVPK